VTISKLAAEARDTPTADDFSAKAAAIRSLIENKLWNPKDDFYEVVSPGKDSWIRAQKRFIDPGTMLTLSGVRELNGYIPWLFDEPRLIGAWPFAFTKSTDNGANWGAVQFPQFHSPIGRYISQPINSVVRTKDGTILIPTDSSGTDADGNGSISAVWGSHDGGRIWYDTGGRTAGRHTTIVMSKSGQFWATAVRIQVLMAECRWR